MNVRRSGAANKVVCAREPEPGPLLRALLQEDTQQLTLPGLPAGFLAYQIRSKRYTVVEAGGQGGTETQPPSGDDSLAPPTDRTP
jgi:hypothetical protein